MVVNILWGSITALHVSKLSFQQEVHRYRSGKEHRDYACLCMPRMELASLLCWIVPCAIMQWELLLFNKIVRRQIKPIASKALTLTNNVSWKSMFSVDSWKFVRFIQSFSNTRLVSSTVMSTSRKNTYYFCSYGRDNPMPTRERHQVAHFRDVDWRRILEAFVCPLDAFCGLHTRTQCQPQKVWYIFSLAWAKTDSLMRLASHCSRNCD